MIDSYYDFRSKNVGNFRSYELDFTKPGDFTEETADTETCLSVSKYPGKFDGKKWIEAEDSSEESFIFNVEYKNKNRVDIRLMSNDRFAPPKFSESYTHVRNAAKKFYLINDVIPAGAIKCDDSQISKKWSLGSIQSRTWEDVEEVLAYLADYNFYVGEPTDLNSWHKSMTVDEAKELFLFLGIEIKFPE